MMGQLDWKVVVTVAVTAAAVLNSVTEYVDIQRQGGQLYVYIQTAKRSLSVLFP